MKVKECMCNKVECVNPNATVSEVAKIMGEKHIGCMPVCDDENRILGLVTDRDLILRCIANEKDCKNTPVKDVMSKDIKTVNVETEVTDVTSLMGSSQIRRIPVTQVNDDKIVGIITVGDLANNNNIAGNEVGATVEKICNCKVENNHAD